MVQISLKDFVAFLSRKAKGKPIVHFRDSTWRAGPHTVQIAPATVQQLVDGKHAKLSGDPIGDYPGRILRMTA